MKSALCVVLILLASLAGRTALATDVQLTPVSPRGSVVDVRNAGDGSHRLFLVEQAGRVWIVRDGQELDTPFLDIAARVSSGGERGLLSLAFPPGFATSRVFYTWYTDLDGATVLSRFSVSADADRADPGSETQILRVDQPRSNHNGGRLLFGPDGYLYLGLGDGGGSGDPGGAGQLVSTLLGKIIRIDVDPGHGTYAIPGSNPFRSRPDTRDEIWALGLRNPWKMSFDRYTGDLYIADVGEARWEEVNVQPAGSKGGENYGWSRMEGTECFRSEDCDMVGLTLPVETYSHNVGCSIVGGEVYRGTAYPALHGLYLYADYCLGRIWGMRAHDGAWQSQILLDTDLRIVSFGEGEDGSVYLAAQGEGVFLLSDGEVVPELQINAGLNDSWFAPETDGQGLNFTVYPDAGVMFVTWFTYDVERPEDPAQAIVGEPGHRWLTAQGGWQGARAELDIFLTSGGVFDAAAPEPVTEGPIGSMIIEFRDCAHATLVYELPLQGLTGSMELTRIAPDNIEVCEALNGM